MPRPDQQSGKPSYLEAAREVLNPRKLLEIALSLSVLAEVGAEVLAQKTHTEALANAKAFGKTVADEFETAKSQTLDFTFSSDQRTVHITQAQDHARTYALALWENGGPYTEGHVTAAVALTRLAHDGKHEPLRQALTRLSGDQFKTRLSNPKNPQADELYETTVALIPPKNDFLDKAYRNFVVFERIPELGRLVKPLATIVNRRGETLAATYQALQIQFAEIIEAEDRNPVTQADIELINEALGESSTNQLLLAAVFVSLYPQDAPEDAQLVGTLDKIQNPAQSTPIA